jgi:hypothetical protein
VVLNIESRIENSSHQASLFLLYQRNLTGTFALIVMNRVGAQGGSMTEKKAKLSRRNFLLTAGAAGVAGAAAIAAKSPLQQADASGKDKRATRGYQASEHINNYYRTTKV